MNTNKNLKSKAVFITATGTDVGKTYITALLVKKLREAGLNAGYYKAALSGAIPTKYGLIPGDAKYVCEISGLSQEPSSLVSYIYEESVSPHLAAARSSSTIELDKIKMDFKQFTDIFNYITVEGSGGIICPLRRDDKSIMLTDVIKELDLSIIIIAPAGLGSINSTVLTVEYSRSQGIQIEGIILNDYEVGNFMHEDNKKEIQAITRVKVIACVAHDAKEIDIAISTLEDCFK